MSIWDSLRGHAEQREMFRRAISRNRLSQAYLLAGPSGIGKQEFARRLAQCLLCQGTGPDPLEACGECVSCRPFLAGAHPDFLYIGCPEGKRELPVSLLVGSAERRGQEGLCHDLMLAPLPGSRKVAIIDDADLMTDEGANAFLKTLEEPPGRTVLLLIVSNLDALLPTIKSRCQLVRFAPLNADDIQVLLLEQEEALAVEDARFAAVLSEGSLTMARQLLDPELRALRLSLYSQLLETNFSGLTLAKQLVDGIAKCSSDTAEQRRNGQWLIRFAVEFFRNTLASLSGQASDLIASTKEIGTFATRQDSQSNGIEQLQSMIERCYEATVQIDQNVPVALVFDTLFDDLSRTLRTPVKTR